MSRSNPFTSTIQGASCLIKWWKENQAGFSRACYHVLLFVDNLSATKKHSRSCGHILTAFTRRNVAWERSSSLQFMQWCFKKMWTWLLVTSMELRGDATTATIIASLKRPLLTALCRCLPAPHHYRDPDRFLAGTTKHGSTSTMSGGTMYNRGVRNIVKGSSWKNGRRRTTTAGRVSVSVILWATIRFLCDIVTIRARPWGDLHRGFCVRLHQVTWWRYTFVLTGARVSFILVVIHPHCMHDHANTACPHQKKRKQTTSRPDTLWQLIWKDMLDASKRKEKQKCAIEKPKLDKAGKLRGIYFIDPDDDEFMDIMKNACMPAAMLCKTSSWEVQGDLQRWEQVQDKIRLHCWGRRIYEKAYRKNSS